MATKGATPHKFPMDTDELTYGEGMSWPARWLIVEITNTAASRYGKLTHFYDAIVDHAQALGNLPSSTPDALVKPPWLLCTPIKKAKDSARRNGGKMLGRGARKPPDWMTVRWAAALCLPDDEREGVLARWAGWWCDDLGVERPPGYSGPILRDGQFQPPLTDPGSAPDVPTCVRLFEEQTAALLGEKETEIAQIRAALVEESSRLRARETQLSAVTTERDELQRNAERVAAELATKDLKIAQLDATLTNLQDARRRVERAHQARVRDLQEEVSKGAILADRARVEGFDQQQNIALLLAVQAGVAQMTVLPPLRAQIAAQTSAGAAVFDELVEFAYAPEASPSARRLAAYIRAHLTMSGSLRHGYGMVRAATGVFEPELRLMLQAKRVPTAEQLEALISYCPPIGLYGPVLHEDARADELIVQFHVDAVTHAAVGPRRTVAELLARYGHDVPSAAPSAPSGHKADGSGSAPTGPSAATPPLRSTKSLGAVWERHPLRWEIWLARVKIAVGLLVGISMVGGICWIVLAAIEDMKVGAVSFQYVYGSVPSHATAADGTLQALIWNDLVTGDSPRSTTFRLKPTGADATITGFTGILHIGHSGDCEPAVALELHTPGGIMPVAIMGETRIDLAHIRTPTVGRWVMVTLTRIDSAACSVRVWWENPGGS